jgi:hypothetical protein
VTTETQPVGRIRLDKAAVARASLGGLAPLAAGAWQQAAGTVATLDGLREPRADSDASAPADAV